MAFTEEDNQLSSEGELKTQSLEEGVMWLVGGLLLGFLVFSRTGQKVSEEAGKFTRSKIPPGETWRLPRVPGIPGLGERRRAPPRAEMQAPPEIPERQIWAEVWDKLYDNFSKCEGVQGVVWENFPAYWNQEEWRDKIKSFLDQCLPSPMAMGPPDIPTNFTDDAVGWDVGKGQEDNMTVNTLRMVAYPYPRRGGAVLEMTPGQIGEYLAKGARGTPQYTKFEVR